MSEPTSHPVAADLLAAVLSPYKPHCRYLESALVEVPARPAEHVVLARGVFGIPESCYIDDTGHFNSVEFNLCYNQLVYTLMAQCVAEQLLPEFAAWTVDEYLARQLPDVLIHEFSSKFKTPMDMRRFTGEVSIREARDRRRFLLLRTHCHFWDEQGGASEGEISLAIVHRDAVDAAGGQRRSGRA